MTIVRLRNEEATRAFGAKLAHLLRPGDVVLLSGDLGAGKSTLARGAISAIAGVDDAPSPTFTFVETYETPDFLLWHFDLYRLEQPSDVWELGFEEALEDGVVLIEWPEQAAALMPEGALVLRMDVEGDVCRAAIGANENWRARLSQAGIA